MHASLPRRALRMSACGLALTAAACGDRHGEDPVHAAGGAQSAEVTGAERARFTAPADSVLTPGQVDRYLRVSLLQFDLVRRDAPRLREELAAIQARMSTHSTLARLRDARTAGKLVVQYSETVGGSHVRAARTLGYNPAEMEWVRERMGDVSGAVMLSPLAERMGKQAGEFRAQARAYREQGGPAQRAAAELESRAAELERTSPGRLRAGAVGRNLEALRRARGNVTDPMWATIGFAGGSAALLGQAAGLPSAADTPSARQFDEWRKVYLDALQNRVTPGLEAGTKTLRLPGTP